MVNQITAQFRTMFQDEFAFDFERTMAKMRVAVHSKGVVNGETAKFDVVDPSDEAIEKTRDGRVPKSDLGLSQVTATLRKPQKKYQIDNFDLFRANQNTRSAMNMRGRSSINKAIDKLILTPDPTAPGGHKIELFGELGAILSLCNNGVGTNAKTRTVGAGVRQVTMVAGAGYVEAPTIDIAA